MKLSGRDLRAFLSKPDPGRPGVLLYGGDAERVAMRRKDLIAAVIGPDGPAEMRLSRITGADLRRDPAAAQDALKSASFFPGPRAALVEEAGDAIAPILTDALAAWAPGDAMLVVTAGALPARSKLRVLFEKHGQALALPIYDDPPDRAEIEAELTRAGLAPPAREAMGELDSLARSLEPGDFRQTLEKIALYKIGDDTPLTADEVLRLAPATVDAGLDDLLHAIAEGRVAEIAPLMQRLTGQGTSPVSFILAASRHLRALHAAVCDPAGPAQGIARVRPPVMWKSRDRMGRQAGNWGRDRLEQALGAVLETDLALRSAGQTAPQFPLVERLFVRLATLARSR